MKTKEYQGFQISCSRGNSFVIVIGLISIICTCIGCGSGTGGSEPTDLPKLNVTSKAFPQKPTIMQKPAIAFNSRGDALAVWSTPKTNSENSMIIQYRIYSQTTGAWSAETELAITSVYGFDVGSNGTDFMLVWSDGNLWAREFDIETGTWGKITIIADQIGASSPPQIDADGSGYIVKRTRYESSVVRVYAYIYDGRRWHAAQAPKPQNGLALNR